MDNNSTPHSGFDLRLLACPAIDNVRIGFIGLGNRGLATLRRYLIIDGITITAICDLRHENINKAEKMMLEAGMDSPVKFIGDGSWTEIADFPEIDLLYICTDWSTHAEIALKAMECGKHVAVEVPAALTISDCWRLVHTALKTRRHCFMLENCCYDPFALKSLEMVRRGFFGDITHCEGAYIHDLRRQFNADENSGGFHDRWIDRYCSKHNGNPYPTHGIGPVSQILDINNGDRFDFLVSISPSPETVKTTGVYMNTTLIRTVSGRSVMLQYDVTTPRPYSRLQTICGTRGFISKYPVACATDGNGAPFYGKELEDLMNRFSHPYIKAYEKDAARMHVDNLMNYIMDRRLIDCLRNGLPLDISIYDAATWSCIAELSEISVRNGSSPVKFPDFTNGFWKIPLNHHP